MIPDALVLLALTCGAARAQDDGGALAEGAPEAPAPAGEVDDDALSPYRARFDVLSERTIGTTSRPVAFNWRRTNVQLAATGSFLFELNNFNTLRGGAKVRVPTGGALIEGGLAYAEVWDTPSSELLALTPYRQPGRPDRIDLDVALGYPLAEGVVTAFPRWFPAVELVFNGYVELRYALYPTGFPGMKVGEVLTALISPRMTEAELDNLDDARLEAMKVDTGRYGFLVGFGNDLYFEQGLFLSPRMMLAVPLLAPANETDLMLYADLSLAFGVAF